VFDILSRKAKSGIRRIEMLTMAMSPSRIIARFNGPKVLANSLPKSGTNVLIRTLSLFPNLTPGPGNVFQSLPIEEIQRKFMRCGKGKFVSGHLYPTEPVVSLLRKYNFKSVLILRDPRDVIISQDRFILNNKNHELHYYLRSFQDQDARLMVQIKGISPEFCPPGERRNLGLNIGERVRLYLPWLEIPSNYTTTFEKLIGPNGGGSIEDQMEEIRNIAAHINTPLSDKELRWIADRVFYRRSPTFRQGIIGSWKRYFKKCHKDAFKEVCGNELILLGYEKDLNW